MPTKKTTKDEARAKEIKKPKVSSRLSNRASMEDDDKIVTPMHSDLHPEKLTYERFSDRQRSLDDDSLTIGKLLLYVALVVIIGVGLTLGVQAYIRSQNENKDQETTDTNTNTPDVEDDKNAIIINSESSKDEDALPTITTPEKFVTKNSSLGTALTEKKSAWEALEYTKFETVERISFLLSEAVNQPEVKAEYKEGEKVLYLNITNLATDEKELNFGAEILKLDSTTSTVESVQNSSPDANSVRISIYLTEAVKYFMQYYNGDLVVDIRQADLVITEDPGDDNTTDPGDDNGTADDEAPDAPHYDNNYSKETQYIASEYTGNKLRVWNYTYRDYGDRYEFKFRVKDDGSGVSPMKPNTKAYLNGDSTNPKLIVEISNINWEILNKQNTDCFDGVGYGNVKKICGEFDASKNMVTYEIFLYRLADFEVDSVDNTQYDSARPGEVIWVKIKDN